MKSSKTTSRKQQHVDITLREDVSHRTKTTGFEQWDFRHNALPEINLSDISTSTTFLGKPLSFPLIIASMTGGYAAAKRINQQLAEICATKGLALGVGSQRQALENKLYHSSFTVVRNVSKEIPIFGNIGGTELLKPNAIDNILRLADLIEADGFAIHLNPLQEFLQPEGDTNFSGVLKALELLVKRISIPVLVKEIGAGISATVASKVLDVGVQYIDVAGAGGTSWAGVEILRTKFKSKQEKKSVIDAFWDWGIPTVDALREVAALRDNGTRSFKIIASGGLSNGVDMAKSVAFGANYVGVARPLLKELQDGGKRAALKLLDRWEREFCGSMFLTGSQTILDLQQQPLVQKRNSYVYHT